MSGGSYSYICYAEVSELLDKRDRIQEMVDRLSGLGYAQDAARESMELLLTLRQFETRIDAMHSRLSDVWKAIEWWDSSDSSENDVKEALKKYRGL